MSLAMNGGAPLRSSGNTVNILLLGMGGENHEGGDLTDTILLFSLNREENKFFLLSLPRDMWSTTLQDKINTAYHYGEEKETGGGAVLTKSIITEITGLPVHYVAIIDFSQFQTMIDEVGGIDVFIPVSFADTEYPIEGKERDNCNGDPFFFCRYKTVVFESGTEHMDGARALEYVRSRHSEGSEGSDFSRTKRQQDVVMALKDAILVKKPWFHPNIAFQLLDLYQKATKTDLSIAEALTVGKFLMQMPSGSMQKISIDTFLEEPEKGLYDRYVLVPKHDISEIQLYIKEQWSQ